MKADNPEQALQNWEALKRQEKHRESVAEDLASVPQAMPALMRATKLSKRAASHGMGRSTQETTASLKKNADEFCKAAEQGDVQNISDMLGRLLFDAADLGRQVKCDAEEALERENRAFLCSVSQP